MSRLGALKRITNAVTVYTYTISSLYLLRAVLLLAQHYTMRSTTVGTALKCRSRKRTHFIASDMSHSGALKRSINAVCSYTISRLCLCQAVLLLAQHYTIHLTTVVSALKCRSSKQTQFIAANMSHLGALKHCKNGMCFDTISRLCLCQAVLLLAQHYTIHLTTVVSALKCRSSKQTQFIATNMSHLGALKHSKNG
eukprot:15538-Heterococcus_DN1.PRE.2